MGALIELSMRPKKSAENVPVPCTRIPPQVPCRFMIIYSSKAHVSEIYQHLVVQIKWQVLNTCPHWSQKQLFWLHQYFLSTSLLSYLYIIYFYIFYTIYILHLKVCTPWMLLYPLLRWRVLSAVFLRESIWREFYLIKVAFMSGSLTLCCLRQTEGSVFKRKSNGSLVQRGAPTVKRQTRQWKVGQSI